MKRLSVIGLDRDRDSLLKRLMDLGTVEITTEKDQEEGTAALFSGGENQALAALDQRIQGTELALETLEEHSPVRAPLIRTRRAISRAEFAGVLTRGEEIKKSSDRIVELREELNGIREAKNRDAVELAQIQPWKGYGAPLDVRGTGQTDLELETYPAGTDLQAVREKMEEVTDLFELRQVNSDKDFVYAALVSMKNDTDRLRDCARQFGCSPAQVMGMSGTAEEAEARIQNDIADREAQLAQVEEKIVGRYSEKGDIECLHDEWVVERDREAVKDKLRTTKRTFRFTGWVPVPAEKEVEAALEDCGCWYALRDPEEGEDVPVLLQNPKPVVPFESVTEMYSLPDYHGIDPTRYFAFFYAMFFGIMLSDAGYGVLITVATAVLLRKFDLEGTTYKMIKMFFYCGISTIFWGALFGGWFGNFVSVFGEVALRKEISVPPIWFDPIQDPTKLLIFSLIFGVIHIFVGMGLNAYMLIRAGKWKDAVLDVFSWYLVIGGAGLWAFTRSNAFLYVAGAGLVILLLTGGRDRKGFGKVIGGLGAVYNVTGYLSDILSYARLLALGLATGVIAQVVNTIGSLAGPGVVGTIVLLVAFVIGHIFNLAINALGAFVHTSRLQYIEFFGKFYIDGGEPFDPFRRKTTYVRLAPEKSNGGK